jgi:hypothetical protein
LNFLVYQVLKRIVLPIKPMKKTMQERESRVRKMQTTNLAIEDWCDLIAPFFS